jgi:hypothetical protein
VIRGLLSRVEIPVVRPSPCFQDRFFHGSTTADSRFRFRENASSSEVYS